MAMEHKEIGPSQHLRDLIEEAANHMVNLKDLRDKIFEQGKKEGFTEPEIIGLVRTELKGRITKHQLFYLLHRERHLAEKREYDQKRRQELEEAKSVMEGRHVTTTDINKVSDEQEDVLEMDIRPTPPLQVQEQPKEIHAFVDLKRLLGALQTEVRECKLNGEKFSNKGEMIIEWLPKKGFYVLKDLEFAQGEEDVINW